MHVVIVGNGVAGMEVALAVRQREPHCDITIVSEESDHFFSRTALMYVLAGQMSPEQIEPYERDVYDKMRFRRIRARARKLDPARRELILSDRDTPLAFDQLVLATGSRAMPSPWGLPRGAGHFVTLQDLEWLERELHGGPGYGGRFPNADAHLPHTDASSPYARRESLRERRGTPPKHPIVIGGGLIGIEVVETFLAARLRPRFVLREDWFWPISLDEREGRFIAARLEEHGVEVELCTHVKSLDADGEGNLTRVVTDCGVHPADLAVIAIGVVPNTEWLGNAVERDRVGGIVVGSDLRTSVEGIYACGDCATVGCSDGSRRPEQLWYTARDQGRVAAKALLGDDVSYDRGIWYNSAKLMDVEYTTVGRVTNPLPGESSWTYEETGKVRSLTRIVTGADGNVIGVNLFGRRWDHALMRTWITERRTLPWVVAHLGEAAFDTELVPPLRIPREHRPPASA